MPRVMFNVVSEPVVNSKALGGRFKIYSTECRNYRDREKLSNAVRQQDGVKAVLNEDLNEEDLREGGAKVFYLADTAPETERRIKDAVRAFSKDLTVRKVSLDTIESEKVVGLLLNSLTSIDSKGNDIVSNAAGKCHVAWEIQGKKSDPDQIVCLSISAKGEDNLVISCSVVSYTNIRFKENIDGKYMQFKSRPFESFPQYRFERRRIAPAPRGYEGPKFLCRGLWEYGSSTHNTVDFLYVYKEARMLRTKSAAIRYTLETFNDLYGDIVPLNLSSKDMCRRELSHDYKADETRVKSILNGSILMCDAANNPDKVKILAEACREQGVTVTIVDGPRPRMPMICLVNDKGVDPEEDTYGRDKISIVQHVQEGSVPGESIKAMIRSLLKELAIKVDIEDGLIRTFDWSSLGFDEDVVFGMSLFSKEGHKPVGLAGVLTVGPAGDLNFRTYKTTDSDAPEWAERLIVGGNELFVARGNDVMSIHKTDMFPVPDVEKISERMMENRENKDEDLEEGYGLRNQESRESLLAAVTDVNWTTYDGCWYYYVGVIGYNMKANIHTASVVRRVEPVEGNLFMEELIPTIDVTFVRNRQSTVIPFPFKYLREYVFKAGYDVARGKRYSDTDIS